ncbi:12971_t:CDS:10 [Acaulospora morrowiae]|uniref:12971_t:CDS:1 n=1 Tax=Acaulospora morrowiae TaxID=94023 RepID=A0A9N8YSU3_9GLOM|nr:12971_t:CDS:10 [Acaulospora morrowiae]
MGKKLANCQETNPNLSLGDLEDKEQSNDDHMEVDVKSVDDRDDNKYDLCELIPGLYRLLDLCKDEGSNGLVDKIIISNEYVQKLCNEAVSNSCRSISKIDFELLNTREIKLIGCYGKNSLIAKLLLTKGIVDQSMYESLLVPHVLSAVNGKSPVPTLRPGIYLLQLEEEFQRFMVIHWSEDGCYKDTASSYTKKNLTNLHRYLTKITTHQICLMDENDVLEDFDWQIFGKDESFEGESEDSEEDSIAYNFEVKKSQEQKENFEIFPGFDTPFEKLTHPGDDHSLSPLIVESVSNQTFLTREIVPSTKTTEQGYQKYGSLGKLQDYFQQRLETQKCALRFSRLLTIDKLKIIVKDVLRLPELFDPYEVDLKHLKKNKVDIKSNAKKRIQEDMKVVEKFVKYQLKETYRGFEDTRPDVSLHEDEIDRIKTNYSDVESQIQSLINKISPDSWYDSKIRFLFARRCADLGAEEKYSVHEVFFNEEKSFNALVKKYITEESNRGLLKYFFGSYATGNSESARDIIDSVKQEAKKIPDNEFVHQIFELGDKLIAAKFMEKYEYWRKQVLPYNEGLMIQNIQQEKERIQDKYYEREYQDRNREIERKHFDEICDKLELLYSGGDLLTILDVERTVSGFVGYITYSYKLFREIEISRPEQLRITIYSTQLSQADALEIVKNELFIPQPMIHTCGGNHGISFEIVPETYDFKYIAQFDRKFLIFLWNKITNKLEIYFDIITRLQKVLKEQTALKKLNLSEDFMVAVNEPKGLVAIYDKIRGSLNAYSFDEERTNLHLRYRNILLQQWYNNDIPDIAHFFFIKNTEDICFVEVNGRARVYNLINNSFRPGIAQLPTDSSRVISTPDGTCFVAFVKETMQTKNISDNSVDPEITSTNETDDKEITSTDETDDKEVTSTGVLDSEETRDVNKSDETVESENFLNSDSLFDQSECSTTEVVRGYVFFSEKFTQNASKVVEIPFKNPSIEFFQFSLFNMRQIHLTTIDQYDGSFQSAIVKITHAKTKYRFERQSAETTLGKVKVEAHNLFIIFGQDTNFKKNIHVGDFIVIGDERCQVVEIISDNKLKISKEFFKSSHYGQWQNFSIEPRTKVNGLLDVYSMVFTKYAISSPIGRADNPLTLTIVIDLDSGSEMKVNECEIKFQRYIEKSFEKFKKDTKKPIGHLKSWIIELFCLIPLQIAITRDQEFIPLRDGVFTSEIEQATLDDGFGLIGSVTKSISFGWYESIFDYYSSLKVKVISSMGEQSCGKSYLLNHCIGSTFDGSAMRCTEGVWMSLVKSNDILYVALDFEGLASIERSSQEETFLQLLNAALSNLARFCIVIKDVARSDRSDIVEEFYSKFARIVDNEEEDNFITKLYRNKMTIFPWPVFTESSFYTSIKKFKTLLDGQESQYDNARMFVEKIKVLMTKLKVCDWGSVQETLITMRTLELRMLLKDAISFGYEQKDDDSFLDSEISQEGQSSDQTIKRLMGRDDGIPIPDYDVFLSDTFEHVDKSIKLMPDTGLVLLKDKGNFVEISADLREYFEKNVYSRGSIPDSEWMVQLDNFFKLIINRRIRRLQEWITKNTSRFPKDHNDVYTINCALNQETSRLNLFWNICRLRCDQCGLSCLKASRHDDDASHDCMTDHKCHHLCEFKEVHNDGSIPQCVNFADHQGKHRCSTSHACGAPCVYSGKRNCQNVCAKDADHHDVEGNKVHLCESTRHFCGAPCSLKAVTQKGKYECRNLCILPCEENHSIHRCENEVCPIECPIANCRERCESTNHFHALEKNVSHFCGNEHQCPKECEEKGICKIVTEPTAIVKEEAEYVSKFGSFMFTKYSQTFQRLPCCVKIPPYMFQHKGKHVHEIKKDHLCDSLCPNDKGKHIRDEENKQNFHYCDEKCPNCAYYCTLPYDHGKKYNTEHSTAHGNMYLTTFTCEDDEFEFEGHRLNVGDRGDFVLCHKVYQLCENIGRHRHIDYCRDPDLCEGPGGRKKEGILEHINDPYSKDDREEFKKCDHECVDEKHHKVDKFSGKEPTKSFCTQEIFHPPLDPTSKPSTGIGYISIDGHQARNNCIFTCENPTTNVGDFHIVFVVDRSGSMNTGDCRPHGDRVKTACIQKSHNNRLGAVYEAIYSFMETRKSSRKATRAGEMSVDQDTVSLVLFDTAALVAFENRSLANSDELLEIMLRYSPGGGTYYREGIKKATDVIQGHYDPSKTNVIIFLSDGENNPPENELRSLCQREKDRGTYLFLYTIMFTGSSGSHARYGQSLQKMADIASEYLPRSNDKESLKCQYVYAMNEIILTEHFTQVAESLRKHKPMLLKK